MTVQNKELIQYRIQRARDTLEDAHILSNAERWNVIDERLDFDYRSYYRKTYN